MPRPQDEEFIRFAVAIGQLTQEQADEALGALREIEQLGGSATAPDMLVNRGALTQQDVDRLHQAIASSKVATKVPRELGGFELLEKIGQGGMGSVFKARQKELDRVVALKVLSPRLSRNKEFVGRFIREARSAGRLNHPNIVAAIDVAESEGFYYFAMEYVDGETLATMLAREGTLPEARALTIATDVARALDHAHAKGLIHRDIKPENIMITRDGRVRVTDFGLARLAGVDDATDPDPDRFVGTPAYAAPEQVRSEPDIDCRADVFALGVTLFQMVTGDLPFQGANTIAIAAAILTEPLPALRKLRPDLSQAATRVIEKMTAKDRTERFATPGEVVAALERAATGPRTTARAPSTRPRTRAKARPAARVAPTRRGTAKRSQTPVGAYIGIAAAIIALLAVLVYLLSDSPSEPPPPPPPQQPTVARPTTPPPPTSSTDAVTKALLADLTKAVAEADGFAKQHPKSYASQLARLQAIHDRFARTQYQLPREGTVLFARAERQLAAVRKQASAAVNTELTRRRNQAMALVKECKYGQAQRLADTFPTELRTEAAAAKIARLRDQIVQSTFTAFDKLDDQGRQLVQQDKLQKARGLYLAVRDCGVPDITQRADEALDKIDKLIAARGDAAERAARQAYPTIAKAVLDRLAVRDTDNARKRLDAAIVDPTLAAVRDRLRTMQPMVRATAEVYARLVAGLKKTDQGTHVRIAGVAGKFVRTKDDRIYIKAGAAEIARSFDELRPDEILAFARRALGKSTPEQEAKFVLFLLARHNYPEARSRLNAIKNKGPEVTAAADLLVRFSPRPCPTCKATKVVPCPTCGGKGTAGVERKPCDECNGKGWFECPKCRGAGRFVCRACKGSGQVFKGIACGKCNGTGYIKCPKCHGRGEVKCRKCKGTGALTRPLVCPQCKGAKTVPCPTCGGKGEFPPPDLVPPKE